ncbi:hypothetical protein KW786_02520 [Candidatus Parcubacteria bacterium]|nr:hypothetical protein [Candidatus Parcubacteria bacterium]
MEDKELIAKLQELKNIKPSNTWVLLSKQNILGNAKPVMQPAYKSTFSSVMSLVMAQRKLAYALASILLVFGGLVGFLRYGLPQSNVPGNSVAVLSAQAALSDFKTKSQNLATVAGDKSPSSSRPLAVKQAKDAVKNLEETIKKDPEAAKSVALDVNNNKTLLNVTGEDEDTAELKASENELYKTLAAQLIKDLEGETLTPGQKDQLATIKEGFNKKGADYSVTLRDILLLKASKESKSS